ncbi:RNA-directed DNA polymerase, eukaryota [Tanacetum coccineum]
MVSAIASASSSFECSWSIRHINQLNEYAVLDRELDMSYLMELDMPYSAIDQNSLEVGSIRRIQVLDTAYWGFLGVGTTLDIFQNIHILYLEYGVLSLSGYGVLNFIPLWSLVSAGTDTSKRLIALSQSAYLEKTLKKFRMENSKKGHTPMMEKPDYRTSQGAKTPSEVELVNAEDRWFWDLNGNGVFCVKDVRKLLDESFLPKEVIATRWIKFVPIKINVFAWKVSLDRLPTRVNLIHRGIYVSSLSCPICSSHSEDTSHLLFSCTMAADVTRLVCRWWDLVWSPLGSYSEWLSWFNSIRLGSNLKSMLEGVFFVTWWCLWNFRNRLLFAAQKPRKDVIFDDIVARSFSWCNARCRSSFSWDSWLQHPSLIPLYVVLAPC